MILITGASGKTGKAIVNALALKREPIRVFVHHPDQARAVVTLGAEQAVVGDLRDEEAVRRAMEGVRSVYHICPNVHPDEITIGQIAIASARWAGVAHFVYHSVLHSQSELMPHHGNKLQVEEMLFQSGLPYTILQPTVYMQNVLAGWQHMIELGVYAVPYPLETRLSLVDLEDVAEAAANVLTELGHTRATYELVGTRALAQVEVAETLTTCLGRPVRAERLNLEAWREEALASGMGDYQVDTLVKMFQYYAQYGLYGNSNILGWLIRRAPTNFMAFVERTMRERGLLAAPSVSERGWE
jgi:uncharacterized protein YbjT (DUF2867 family)